MRKERTSSLKPRWTPHANCFIVPIMQCWMWASLLPPFKSSSCKQTAASPDVGQSTGFPPPQTLTVSLVGGETAGCCFFFFYPLSSFAACSNALSDAADPSNLWEAMAAWWDMLFLTTSPFLHRVISWMEGRQRLLIGLSNDADTSNLTSYITQTRKNDPFKPLSHDKDPS